MARVPKYQTTNTYPQLVTIRGVDLAYVYCTYCNTHVWLDDQQRIIPHLDIEPLRWCEGGNRHYWNLHGTRLNNEGFPERGNHG